MTHNCSQPSYSCSHPPGPLGQSCSGFEREGQAKFRLKYKRSNGDSVHLYDVFEKIVKWVEKIKEVGDVAEQYDPGHAALAWAAIRFLLQVCHCWEKESRFDSLVEMLSLLTGFRE